MENKGSMGVQNGGTKMQKAMIIVYGDSKKEIEVLFNPREYTLKHGAAYADSAIAGSDIVISQFAHAEPGILQVPLIIDESARITIHGRYPASDITPRVKALIQMIYMDGSKHRPPHVEFQWGSLKFKGIVTEISSKFIKFDKDGKPVRAEVELTIKEVMDPLAKSRTMPLESPDRTKCRMITAGKTLFDIAYEEYGSMTDWRMIAGENGIGDPLHIPDGQLVKVPVKV